MKALLIIFTSFSMMALAQTEEVVQNNLSAQDYERLGQRFVSTIKETQVDQQMLSVGPIQKCLDDNRITETDITQNSGAEATRKRQAAATCLQTQFQNVSDGDLEQLSTQLDLQNFGLVQGKSRKVLTDFFTERIQSALYGTGATGEQLRMRDNTIVDHKVFNDIYESKLSKNFLLELSRYCYQDLLPVSSGSAATANSPSYYSSWQSIISTRSCDFQKSLSDLSQSCFPSKVTDESPALVSSSTTDIYKAFADALPSSGSQGDLLQRMFNTCTSLVPKLCTTYTYCSELNRTGANQAEVRARYPEFNAPNQVYVCPQGSKLGEKSCTMQAKIKSYRDNLLVLNKTKEDYEDLNTDPRKAYRLNRETNPVYDPGGVSADRSIESITTLTSSDLNKVNTEMVEQYNEEFTRENCEQNPENKQCEKFFYSNEEAVKFANQELTYLAATEKEKAEIRKLRGDNKKLKEYLENKGYKDILEKLNGPNANENDIIALVQERFSAERSASFSSMEEAFKKKQLITETTDQGKIDKAKGVKDSFQSEGERFNQLLLFNNVVTSFLEVGTGDNARSNSAIFEREFDSIRDGGTSDATALEFFSNLGSGPSGNGSNDGPNENVVIDLNYIDQVLGAPDSETPN